MSLSVWLCLPSLVVYTLMRSGLICDCVCAPSAQPAVAPTTRLHIEKREGKEARLTRNSSAWPHSSFLAELRETEGKKLNSCCAVHATAYSNTAATQ